MAATPRLSPQSDSERITDTPDCRIAQYQPEWGLRKRGSDGRQVIYPELMISPGKTIDSHAEISSDCFACHTPFIGSTADKCMACHKVADIGIRTTRGLAIDKEKKNVAFHDYESCVECHRSGDEDEAETIWRSRRMKQGSVDGRNQRGRREHDDD